MREIDLEPSDYRQANEPGEPVHQPVLTREAPVVFAGLFCFGFCAWLVTKFIHAFFVWLTVLLAVH